MSERDIFLDALDRTDPADRAGYLDRACGGEMGLRRRIEGLLAAHEAAGGFLKTPVPASDVAEAATVAPTDVRSPTGAVASVPTREATATSDLAATSGPLAEGPGS